MNKKELINAAAEASGVSKKDAGAVIDASLECISKTLRDGEKVQLIGFGTFELRERAARDAINPQTKEKIHIEASKVPAFKAGKALKDSVNK